MADARSAAQVSAVSEQVELLLSKEEVSKLHKIIAQLLINCSLPVWYEKFKNITFKSVFLPLSQELIDYLNSDGCILPTGCELPSLPHTATHTDSDDDDLDQVKWSDSEEESEELAPSFPDFIDEILTAIQHLDGAVFPKLNWSSPRDAVWIAPGHTLKCTSPAEIFLLLKSSDFIAHDLTRASKYCKTETSQESSHHHIKYTLCLRRWFDVLPSMEFRCFVCNKCLIAISQRNNSAFYQFLQDNRDRIRTEIIHFFRQEIAGKFPNTNYVFDIVREAEDKFLLVDFNPYCAMTDSLLFSWEELTSDEFVSQASNNVTLNNDHPVFRLVDGVSIQPSDLQSLQLPLDVVDIATGVDVHKFVDLMQAKNAAKLELEGED